MDFYRRSSVHPRASIFPNSGVGSAIRAADAPRPYLQHLEACIAATNQGSETLRATLEDFHDGTGDLPRLTKVLQNTRLFVLIDEDTLRRYKAQLADEIEPQVTELIGKAEKALGVLERREALLQKKLESQQTRASAKPAVLSQTNKGEERRMKLMAARQERLSKELKALEDEVASLEKQLGEH